MVDQLTISQLNKIGERLRQNLATDEDLRSLDKYISSFTPAFDYVFENLTKLGLNPGGRSHKTTQSIVAKLNRERTRLSKMQDIAGCRIEVQNRIEQDRIAAKLRAEYAGAHNQDRRVRPSHGYRAVHLLVQIFGHPIEIQIRTTLQHAWASTAERLADDFGDIGIKYGGGPENIRESLSRLSEMIADFESIEAEYLDFRPQQNQEERFSLLAEKLQAQKARLRKLCENTMIISERR